MLIDCDTCTVRGQGCDDCVVTVLLGVPPDWRGSDPTVVPLTRRGAARALTDDALTAEAMTDDALTDDALTAEAMTGDRPESAGDAPGRTGVGRDVPRIDSAAADVRPVVELDDVERRAVRALAEFGLVPPLRHQDASMAGDRHVS